MTRLMKSFVDARREATGVDVRVDVPVFLPGYAAIGKFGADPSETFSGLVATVYSIPSQIYRVTTRNVLKVTSPDRTVYQQASLRNFEIAMTDSEILYCPTSPLMLKAYEPTFTEPIAGTSINFETVTNKMSKLRIGDDLWHVHPAYAGDVRWALRRIADDNPSYDITFGGVELPESVVDPDDVDEPLDEVSADEEAEAAAPAAQNEEE